MKISKRRYYKLIHKFKYGKERGKNNMLKLLAKVAEKCAKSTNTACGWFGWIHQPKMPASLIKKD